MTACAVGWGNRVEEEVVVGGWGEVDVACITVISTFACVHVFPSLGGNDEYRPLSTAPAS